MAVVVSTTTAAAIGKIKEIYLKIRVYAKIFPTIFYDIWLLTLKNSINYLYGHNAADGLVEWLIWLFEAMRL